MLVFAHIRPGLPACTLERHIVDAIRSLREEEILELQTRLFLRDVAGQELVKCHEVPLDAHSEVMPQTKGSTDR